MSIRRILVADDEESIRWVLSKSLKKQGFSVDLAEDGLQALQLSRKNRYDLAVLDIKMPGLQGIELLQTLQQEHPETLVVVSSDLSHYLDYATARRMDSATSRAIEALDPTAIDFEQACGRIPVQGLLLVARRHGLRATAVDVRNSGDTAGPRDQVVGYGAYVLC